MSSSFQNISRWYAETHRRIALSDDPSKYAIRCSFLSSHFGNFYINYSDSSRTNDIESATKFKDLKMAILALIHEDTEGPGECSIVKIQFNEIVPWTENESLLYRTLMTETLEQ